MITSPNHEASEPTVALTAVPAAIAHSMPATPPSVDNGRPRPHNRCISSTAVSTSARFPALWASADPTGNAE